MEPNKFSSEQIKNEVLTITSEHPYHEDNSERRFQSKISTSNQNSEQLEEELIQSTEKKNGNKQETQHGSIPMLHGENICGSGYHWTQTQHCGRPLRLDVNTS